MKTNLKKISIILVLVAVFAMSVCIFSACGKTTSGDAKGHVDLPDGNVAGRVVLMDGDIKGDVAEIDLGGIKKVEFSYSDDGKSVSAEGWDLEDILKKVEYLYNENKLMITGGDGTSTVIGAALTSKVYLYEKDGQLCCKAPDYPPASGIRGIADITVVTTAAHFQTGYKILTKDKTEYVSRGNAKLRLFKKTADNRLNGNVCEKYVKRSIDFTVNDFTDLYTEKPTGTTVYFKDCDYIPNLGSSALSWKDGALYCVYDGKESKEVYGFAAGNDCYVHDVYYRMKDAIDAGERVMFVLTDGFSAEQADKFSKKLTLLRPDENTKIALSVHRAITPVALAAITTGKTPHENGVWFKDGEQRRVLTPQVPDIFDYAREKGKSIAYIQGSGAPVNLSERPKLTTSYEEAFRSASTAIDERKDVIFVHFHNPDDTNHEFGPISDEAEAAVLQIEDYIMQLKDKFKGKLIVTSDHGHVTMEYADEHEHGKEYGQHGLFRNEDMFVYFFEFDCEGE